MALDSMKPRPHEPCRMPPIKPRERIGQVSIARAAPAGHSPPMPMPSSARNRNRKAKLGEKPAAKLASEYHRIEIISGILRPTRSASQPEPTAPTSRSHKVTDSTNATSGNGTLNSCEIGTMISRNMVKSKASSVQPSQAAHQASHWSLVGSFHHGIGFIASCMAVIAAIPPMLFAEAVCKMQEFAVGKFHPPRAREPSATRRVLQTRCRYVLKVLARRGHSRCL